MQIDKIVNNPLFHNERGDNGDDHTIPLQTFDTSRGGYCCCCCAYQHGVDLIALAKSVYTSYELVSMEKGPRVLLRHENWIPSSICVE